MGYMYMILLYVLAKQIYQSFYSWYPQIDVLGLCLYCVLFVLLGNLYSEKVCQLRAMYAFSPV